MKRSAVQLLEGKPHKSLSSESLDKLETLYFYYHKLTWYYKEMHGGFKLTNTVFNGVALLLLCSGIIITALWPESFAMIVLTAASTAVKGWCEFKRYPVKISMCLFAYTTYEKILTQLNLWARGMPMEDFEGWMLKVQVNEETITDLAPPASDSLMNRYVTIFITEETIKEEEV